MSFSSWLVSSRKSTSMGNFRTGNIAIHFFIMDFLARIYLHVYSRECTSSCTMGKKSKNKMRGKTMHIDDWNNSSSPRLPLSVEENLDLVLTNSWSEILRISACRACLAGRGLRFKLKNIKDVTITIELVKWSPSFYHFSPIIIEIPPNKEEELCFVLIKNVAKEWADCHELEKFPWIEIFLWIERTKYSSLCWLKYDYKPKRNLWIPSFTDKRPIVGGFKLREESRVKYNGCNFGSSLKLADIQFDQSLLVFIAENITKSSIKLSVPEWLPLKCGIRIVFFDLNGAHEKKLETHPKKGIVIEPGSKKRIFFTFWSPMAQSYLKWNDVRLGKEECPYFKVIVINEETKKREEMMIKLKWENESWKVQFGPD